MEVQYSLRNQGWTCKQNPHLCEKMDSLQAKALLGGGGCFVRNTFNWDKPDETQFWYVIKENWGDIDELPSKTRNQVRKSLKCYDVKMVSPEIMVRDGFELYNESRKRFNDPKLMVNKEQWKNRCLSGGQEFWLAYSVETGKPEAMGINRKYDDYCSYVTMGVNPEAPTSSYPMYGLIFKMNQYYLCECGLKYVLDGARSVTEHSNIQPFLEEKFKFRKAYCDMQVFYKPLIGMAVKVLFPFRKWIKDKRIEAILRQEAWARDLEK